MIQLKSGDLLASNAQTLVNTVNCVGIMGKGIALDFKRNYPDMYRDYVSRCSDRELRPGVPYLYQSSTNRFIVNFPTKNHWKSKSKMEYVRDGLEVLLAKHQAWGIESIAMPPLGCGNGGLDWNDVGPVIFSYLNQMEIPVELFVPPGVVANDSEYRRLSAQSNAPTQVQLSLGLLDATSSPRHSVYSD